MAARLVLLALAVGGTVPPPLHLFKFGRLTSSSAPDLIGSQVAYIGVDVAKENTGVRLDGADTATLWLSTGMDALSAMTIAVVARWDSGRGAGALPTVFACGSGGGLNSIELGSVGGDSPTIQFRVTKGSYSRELTAQVPLATNLVGRRLHVVGSVSATGVLKLYIDGVLRLSDDSVNVEPLAVVSRGDCYVGRRVVPTSGSSDGDPNNFIGEVSSLAMYGSALTDLAVGGLYATNFPFLEHSWSFVGLTSSGPGPHIDSVAGSEALLTGGNSLTAAGVALTGSNYVRFSATDVATRRMGGPFTIEIVILIASVNPTMATSVLEFSTLGSGYRSAFALRVEPQQIGPSVQHVLSWNVWGAGGTPSEKMSVVATTPVHANTRYHVVACVAGMELELRVNGVVYARTADASVTEPEMRAREGGSYLGKSLDSDGLVANFHGELSRFRTYTGWMSSGAAASRAAAALPVTIHSWSFAELSGPNNNVKDAVPRATQLATANGAASQLTSRRATGVGLTEDAAFYTLAPFSAPIGGAEGFAISAIVQWNDQTFTKPEASPRIFDCSNGVDDDAIQLFVTTTYQLGFIAWKGALSNRAVLSIASLDVGRRYHVIASIDAVGAILLYVNGVAAALATPTAMNGDGVVWSGAPEAEARSACYIGNRVGSQRPMWGEISSVELFAGPMVADRAQAEYARAFPILEYFWDFRMLAGMPMDGTLVLDSVAQRSATLHGGASASFGASGAVLAGSDDYIALDLGSLYTGGAMTIVAVAKAEQFLWYMRLIDCGNGAGVDNFYVSNDGTTAALRWEVWAGAPPGVQYTSLGTQLPLDTFAHVVVTVSGSAMNGYIDGAEALSLQAGAEPRVVKRTQCYIGLSNWVAAGHIDDNWKGVITSLKIYSGAMTPADAASSYRAYSAAPASFPTALPTSAPTNAPVTLAPITTPTAKPTAAPTNAPVTLSPTSAAPTTAPTAVPTTLLETIIRMTTAVQRVREDNDAPRDVLTLFPAAAPDAISSGSYADVTCASSDPSVVAVDTPASLTMDHSGNPYIGGGGAIRAHAVRDGAQLKRRAATVTCEIETSNGRTSQPFDVHFDVLGVAQPSFAALCPLAAGASGAGPLPASCGANPTAGENRTLLIVGCVNAARCPQPPFSARTTVVIGGVHVAASLVPGTGGERLLVRTPSIAQLVGPGGDVDAFEFTYYAVELHTAAGAEGVVGGNVSFGRDAPLAASSAAGCQGESCLECAARGLCPDAIPSSAGLYYSDECEGFLDAATDARWKEAAHAASFAYGQPPKCRACPHGCTCPGGDRCFADAGYYVGGESLGGASEPQRCMPPALTRCIGYSAAVGGTACGEGFAQGNAGCEQCAMGYFPSMGGCDVCPAVDVLGAIAMPAIANVAVAVAAFLSVFGLKLVWSLVSARCDPDDARPPVAVAYDALRQTAYFVVSVVVALQLLAAVVVGATGEAPPMLKTLALALGAFVFEPPMVNPACVEAGALNWGAAAQWTVLGGALAAALLDKALQLCPCLRAEALCFGWKCCSKYAAARGARRLFWSRATPAARYVLSTGLTVVYVRIARVAVRAVDCHPSAELGGALALDADRSVPCLGANAPVYSAAVAALALVCVAWPALSVALLAQRFGRRPLVCCARVEAALWRRRCCDSAGRGALDAQWEERYSARRGALYYVHAVSGERTWQWPGSKGGGEATAAPALGAAAGEDRGALARTPSALHVVARIEALSTVLDAAARRGSVAPGWEELTTAAGRRYYHHAATGETRWEKPTYRSRRAGRSCSLAATAARASASAAAAATAVGGGDDDALPSGWVALRTEAGQVYYHCAATGATSWARPSASTATAKVADALPTGWEAHTDAATGATYYHHRATSSTSWELPSGGVEAEGEHGGVGDTEWSGEAAEGSGGRPSALRACAGALNELGCIAACARTPLGLHRARLVQLRVDDLGGRARAYDVYVDNAFEPRFFWIPALRMYTLLLLTVFDLGLSGGGGPATMERVVARFVLSTAVVLVFTVAVLAPCPYHRTDRWNVAKRVALLVLNVVGAATTLALSLVELDVGGARDAVERLTVLLVALLPICFGGVLIAFLLSRGTGCCRRLSCKTQSKLADDALKSRGVAVKEALPPPSAAERAPPPGEAEEAAEALARHSTTSRGSLLGRASIGLRTILSMGGITGGGGFGSGDGDVQLSVFSEEYAESRDSGPLEYIANPAVRVIAAPRASKRFGVLLAKDIFVASPLAARPRPVAAKVVASEEEASEEVSAEEETVKEEEGGEEAAEARFVTWRRRRSSAPTLAVAIYGDGEQHMRIEAIGAHIRSLFGDAQSLSVQATLALLRRRAAGTPLAGDMLAQMKLVEASTDEATHRVERAEFPRAVRDIVVRDTNGAVAEWLLDELEALDARESESDGDSGSSRSGSSSCSDTDE